MSEACETCHRIPDHTLHSHHAIPRYMGCSDDRDIVQICKSCHKRADWSFERLILYPFGKDWILELRLTGDGRTFVQNLKSIRRFERVMLDPDDDVRGHLHTADPNKKRRILLGYRPNVCHRRISSKSVDGVDIKTMIHYNKITKNITITNEHILIKKYTSI